jgi:hypothetical protein
LIQDGYFVGATLVVAQQSFYSGNINIMKKCENLTLKLRKSNKNSINKNKKVGKKSQKSKNFAKNETK